MSDTAWMWDEVAQKVQNPVLRTRIMDLDAMFRKKDAAVQYHLTMILIVMMWCLVITVFASGQDVVDQRDNIVRVFCLTMVGLALLVTIRRMWVVKYHMLHPALTLLQADGPVSDVAHNATRVYLCKMVFYIVVSICAAIAGAICLLGTTYKTQAAGVGLCVATTFVLRLTSLFYRYHAGVHMQAITVGSASPGAVV